MHLGEDGKSALGLALGDVPTWRFRDEPHAGDLEDGRQSLDDGGNTPRPLVGNAVGAVGEPSGHDGANIPGGVVLRCR